MFPCICWPNASKDKFNIDLSYIEILSSVLLSILLIRQSGHFSIGGAAAAMNVGE